MPYVCFDLFLNILLHFHVVVLNYRLNITLLYEIKSYFERYTSIMNTSITSLIARKMYVL
jgi:hypothetical protein